MNLFPQQFEYRILTLRATFHRQALLQDRLTDLKDLIGGEGQAVSQDLQKLIVRVSSEIEIWLNRGEGAMTFEAQITLSNMAYSNGPTKNNICNQFSCTV